MEVRESGRLYTRQGGSTQLQHATTSSDLVQMVPQTVAQDDDLAGPAAQNGHGKRIFLPVDINLSRGKYTTSA